MEERRKEGEKDRGEGGGGVGVDIAPGLVLQNGVLKSFQLRWDHMVSNFIK